MDRRLVMSLVALAVVAGAAAAFFLLREDPATPGAETSCATGSSLSPDGKRCVSNAEVCNSWFDGVASETVQCTTRSPDGSGTVRLSLQGTGTVRVSVLDGSGASLQSRTYRFDGALQQDVPVAGKAGDWTLSTSYQDASGSGRIILWG